ncbi:MAG: DUF3093 domain-containing protein [Acidothermus sp.]|nr:DUF3093 domain-containing protein [Acidothermus sp.]
MAAPQRVGPAVRDNIEYRERLAVPWYWWLVALLFVIPSMEAVVVLGPQMSRRPSLWVALVGVAASVGLVAAVFAPASRTTIRVDRRGLRIGALSLPAEAIGRIRVLDRPTTRLVTGPQARADAVLRLRPWIREAVQVEVLNRREPYWVISTRHPDQLAAALGRVASRS